jgi:hypothetical protein
VHAFHHRGRAGCDLDVKSRDRAARHAIDAAIRWTRPGDEETPTDL